MPQLVGYLMLFIVVGVGFILVHLLAGKLLRPVKPDPEKLTIYECGEPTIGSAWIQFDLRFYVVALLFVIFDVEVAFFFPWAVVFGKACTLANDRLPAAERMALTNELVPPQRNTAAAALNRLPEQVRAQVASQPEQPGDMQAMVAPGAAHDLAWIAFLDIAVFFGVLLVGFAYLWKRGDLDWVRSVASERAASRERLPSPERTERELVSAGSM